MMQTSLLVGNTFVFFEFRGLTDVSTGIRTVVVVVLSAVCAAGVAVFGFLRPTPWAAENASQQGRACTGSRVPGAKSRGKKS